MSLYPLELKRGSKIHYEGREYKVNLIDAWHDSLGFFRNKVGIETTTGVYLLVPVSFPLETEAPYVPVAMIKPRD